MKVDNEIAPNRAPDQNDKPTKEEVVAWAKEQRIKFRDGDLHDGYIKLLEEIPGWTWESE